MLRKLNLFFCSGEEKEALNFLGPLQLSASLHLKTETDQVSETLWFLVIEFQTKDEVHRPSDSECYTPSSEPLSTVYLFEIIWPPLWSSGQSSWLRIQRPISIRGATRFSEK
jgi:hypothetical protein